MSGLPPEQKYLTGIPNDRLSDAGPNFLVAKTHIKKTTKMKEYPTKHQSISRRRFLSSCVLTAAAAGLSPKLLEAAKRSADPIEIPSFDPKSARQNILHYTQNGYEPPIPILLGVLIANDQGISEIPKPCETMKAFFSVTRVRRILRYVSAGRADSRVTAKLQSELNRTGRYSGMTPPWMYYAVWLKVRIIDSFEPEKLPFPRIKMIIEMQPKIEDLVRLPLRKLE